MTVCVWNELFLRVNYLVLILSFQVRNFVSFTDVTLINCFVGFSIFVGKFACVWYLSIKV